MKNHLLRPHPFHEKRCSKERAGPGGKAPAQNLRCFTVSRGKGDVKPESGGMTGGERKETFAGKIALAGFLFESTGF